MEMSEQDNTPLMTACQAAILCHALMLGFFALVALGCIVGALAAHHLGL